MRLFRRCALDFSGQLTLNRIAKFVSIQSTWETRVGADFTYKKASLILSFNAIPSPLGLLSNRREGISSQKEVRFECHKILEH